jgi:hypothetical protein
MTTEELVLQINRNHRVRAEKIDGRIFVYNDTSHLLFTFDEKATNFLDFTFNDQLPSDSMAQPSREYVAAQIEEYLQTPIKERFPEKKYHLATLQYPKDATPIKQYVSDIIVGYDHVNFYFGSKEKAGVWADSDLNYLSQYFPKEAIDAMEEPAEDDE